jgi:hypothetical protein
VLQLLIESVLAARAAAGRGHHIPCMSSLSKPAAYSLDVSLPHFERTFLHDCSLGAALAMLVLHAKAWETL